MALTIASSRWACMCCTEILIISKILTILIQTDGHLTSQCKCFLYWHKELSQPLVLSFFHDNQVCLFQAHPVLLHSFLLRNASLCRTAFGQTRSKDMVHSHASLLWCAVSSGHQIRHLNNPFHKSKILSIHEVHTKRYAKFYVSDRYECLHFIIWYVQARSKVCMYIKQWTLVNCFSIEVYKVYTIMIKLNYIYN